MKNKGKILSFLVIFTALFSVLSPVLAKTDTGFIPAGRSAGYNTTNHDIVNYIQLVINFLLSAVAFVFFAMILYGGLRWMTSRGQEQLKEKAIDAITNAVIGLVIVVGAYALVTFVFSKLNPAPTSAVSTESSGTIGNNSATVDNGSTGDSLGACFCGSKGQENFDVGSFVCFAVADEKTCKTLCDDYNTEEIGFSANYKCWQGYKADKTGQ